METVFQRLPEALLPWYRSCKRDLPWRVDRNPYHIWVSEIMLQQTRVEAVKGYYRRFLETLPDIESLANADDDLLHKLWEGLGYYSRVRNLKRAAQTVMTEHGGVFPGEYDKILSLSGIGEYTAGAISSIAFDLPVPAVDGNVLRVAARLTDNHTPVDKPSFKREVRDALAQIYPQAAGDFTQALMELGATLCGPNRAPECERCPCNAFCLGHRQGTAAALPRRTPKRSKRTQELTVLILRCEDRYALEKRPPAGLLAGLWQFPNMPGKMDAQEALLQVERMGLKPKEITRQVEREHIFTHIKWEMCGVYVDVKEMDSRHTWLTAEQIDKEAALPTAFRQFWDIGEDRNGK